MNTGDHSVVHESGSVPMPTARQALHSVTPRPQKRLDGRLDEVAKAVGGPYCRLQMPLRLALAARETVAGRKLGALEGGVPPPIPMHPCGGRGGGGAVMAGQILPKRVLAAGLI